MPGIGPKAFANIAGFLRVTRSDGTPLAEPLDATRVHPESYAEAKALLRAAGVGDAELRVLAGMELGDEDALCGVSR